MICHYLRTRNDNPAISAALDAGFRSQQAAIENIHQQLVRGEYEEDQVWTEFDLPECRSVEGCMSWGETWCFPSAALRMSMDRFGVYDPACGSLPPPFPLPRPCQGSLTVCLKTKDQQLDVVIPLTSLPWLEARWWACTLKPLAKQARQRPNKFKQMYLQEFLEPPLHTGERLWRMRVDDETSEEEVLTYLVIGALKQGFPAVGEDQQAALRWVQHVVQDGVRPLGGGDSQQVSEEVIGEVFQALVERFDLSPTPWAFRDYIKETARGRVLDERKKHLPQTFQEPWDDPASGERRYPDAWVAQECGVSTRTVARWRANQGITRQGLSESKLVGFRQEREPKRQREQLRRKGLALRMDKETVRKAIQRGKQKGLPPKAIEATLERNAAKQKHREAEAAAPSEDAMSLEHQIAEWEARLAEAELGSDEWCDARDALQQLRQRQQGGAHP